MWLLFNIQQFTNQPWVEWIAAISGIASVWFAKKENILVYPTGILSVGLYILICFFAKLYADAFINFYYLLISIFGWYYWLTGGRFQERTAERSTHKAKIVKSGKIETIAIVIITILIFVIIGNLLQKFTDSNVPWFDALNTAFFITAMYLMAKKNILHWYFWIAGNIVSIPLYLYKDLPVTAVQYIVFLVLAIAGYMVWNKKLSLNGNPPN